jgi:threonylcarbamoyladenosine tRNA methylthiotransferase MtaB
MKSVKFITLGCKVNQYDTQGIRERFINSGFNEIYNGKRADIYVINTCTVTSSADTKSRYFINYAHRQNPKAKIIVTGCYVMLDSGRIARIPGVTHIVKNQEQHRIVELLNKSKEAGGNKGSNGAGISGFFGHTRAFLKIQDGCNNRCSYCRVCLARGHSRSKPANGIIKEARELVKGGFKEIVLCGICLGAYGRDLKGHNGLVDLIGALEGIEGLLRIRLSSIEAGDISEGLISKMAVSGKLCRHLHIPIQSGDDDILKKMNRRYSRDDYRALIKKIKDRIPGVAITTDIMVGFPGEGERNFRNTLDLAMEIMPLRAHIFPYSRRPGTSAALLKDGAGPVAIRERIGRLREAVKISSFAYKKQFKGKEMDLLIEERSKRDNGYWEGYTDNYIRVKARSVNELKNKIIKARLEKVNVNKDCIEGSFIIK